MPVTLATADAGAVAAVWLAAWLPAGCVAAGWAAADCAAAGWDAAGWVWADGPWLLPRPWVALLTVPVTPLTAPARPLVAGGGEPAAWPAPLAVADGCAGASPGRRPGWPAARCSAARCSAGRGAGWAGAGWDAAGWAGAGCDELAGAEAGGGAAGWAELDDGGGLGWVRLCTALLAAPVSEAQRRSGAAGPGRPRGTRRSWIRRG